MEERYLRADVLRIVGISARQLSGWEKSGLVAAAEAYSFTDLVQLTKLRDLAEKRIPARTIQRTLKACSTAGLANPLVESNVVLTAPRRIAVKHEGAPLDPENGQFILDFNPRAENAPSRVVPIRSNQETVNQMFMLGVQCEESASTLKQAVEIYQRLLSIEPNHAPAHINLGTIYYNQQNFTMAEKCYRAAIAADGKYALAYFDLGNVLDETGRLEEAVGSYEKAIDIAPEYADAHYNVALAYERLKQPRKALPHWRSYVKLDPVGPWSNHARTQIERIMSIDQLKLVWKK